MFGMHSPCKSKKFNEPTISSLRKTKTVSAPIESSLSSRSISKDKKPGSLPKRVKLTGKYINKNKSVYEDEAGAKPKQSWRKKKTLLGHKKYNSSSQRSLNSNDSKTQAVNLTVSR